MVKESLEGRSYGGVRYLGIYFVDAHRQAKDWLAIDGVNLNGIDYS